MKKSITKNYIYNLIYQILIILIPLITTPYLSRVLGVNNIGIYSYTLSIVTYFILFGSLGISLYGQREIAYYQDNKKKRSKTFWEIITMRFISLGLSLILFYISFCRKGEYLAYYKILILEIIANAFDISWFFQGIEEFKKTVMRNMLVKILSVFSIFIFVKNQSDLYKYFCIYVFSNLIGNMSLWFYLRKYIEKIEFKELNVFKHLKPTISLFIPQIAVQIYTVLDKTMIGSIVSNKEEVGYYEQAQKIVKLLLSIATSIGIVMVPRMANCYYKGEKEKIKTYINKSFSFILMIAFPLMFGITSISKKFVPIFYGEGYDKVVYLISLISPIILAIGLSNVTGTQYLLPTKQQKKFTISVVAGAISNFILNLIFINLWQSIGASIATVIAEFVVTGVQFYLLRKEIKIKDVINIGKKYFIAGIIMFIVSVLIGNNISNNLISIVVQTITGGIIYFIVLILLKDEFLLNLIKTAKEKVCLLVNK